MTHRAYLWAVVSKWRTSKPASSLADLFMENNALMGIYWVLCSWRLLDQMDPLEDQQRWAEIVRIVTPKLDDSVDLTLHNGLLRALSLVQIYALIGNGKAKINAIADKVDAFLSRPFPFFFDMRSVYCVLAIARIARRELSHTAKLRQYITESECVLGGFGSGPNGEPHGGFTFCALASLAMLHAESDSRVESWRALRLSQCNGRVGKPRDSCYLWWLGSDNTKANMKDFECKSGGYSKYPNMDEPDLFHTFLALATLARAQVSRLFELFMCYIAALRRVTDSPAVLKASTGLFAGDLLAESIPLIGAMSCSELRQLSKSALIVNRAFPTLKLNPQIFKLINKRIVAQDAGIHELVATLGSLSQVKRARHDGGPPLLHAETVEAFVRHNFTHMHAFDKCELLSVLARMRLRLSDHLEIWFLPEDIAALSLAANSDGRICGAIIALAKLDVAPTDALLALLPPRLSRLSTMELANVLYACAMQHVTNELLVTQIVKQLERNRAEISLASTNQLGVASLVFVQFPFLKECLSESTKWKESNVITTSKAQAAISRSFDSLGIRSPFLVEEFAVGPFRLDFAFPQLQLAIEINGPFHYYHQTQQATAKTKFKRKLLLNLGWKVAEIDQIDGDKVKLVERVVRDTLGVSEPGKLAHLLAALVQKKR